MSMKRKSFLAIAIALVVAVSSTVALLATDDGSVRQGGQAPSLEDAENVTSESSGVVITVRRANYSGTATFLEMSATVLGKENERTAVTIPGGSFEAGGIGPVDLIAGIQLRADGSFHVIRLRAPVGAGPYRLAFDAVDVRPLGDALSRVSGDWHFQLKGPSDPAKSLALETLNGGPASIVQGVAVTPVKAIRSSNETLVTVRIEGPDGVGSLALPRLAGSDPQVFGAQIEANPETGTSTFAFPNTEAGTELRVAFDSFVVPRAGDSAGTYVDIKLGELLARQGVKGQFKDEAVVDRADVLGSEPAAFQVVAVWFAHTTADLGDEANLISFSLRGTVEDASGFSVQVPDGRLLRLIGWGSDYGTGITGIDDAQVGKSYVQFLFERGDLDGNVRLTFGQASQVVSGPWEVAFQP